MQNAIEDSTNEPVIRLNTDGSCHGNPGPGGYAAVLEIPNQNPMRISGREASTTNNRMELRAVIEGMKALHDLTNVDGVRLEVHTDSRYIVDAFGQNWIGNWKRNRWRTSQKKPVANRELWEELVDLAAVTRTSFNWVRGHSGDPMNELCDRLANEQADRAPAEGDGGPDTDTPTTDNPTTGGAPALTPEPTPEPDNPGDPEARLARVERMLTGRVLAIDRAHSLQELRDGVRRLGAQ